MYRPTLAETMSGKLTRCDSVRLVGWLHAKKLIKPRDGLVNLRPLHTWS
jgi:hypothetical protein